MNSVVAVRVHSWFFPLHTAFFPLSRLQLRYEMIRGNGTLVPVPVCQEERRKNRGDGRRGEDCVKYACCESWLAAGFKNWYQQNHPNSFRFF